MIGGKLIGKDTKGAGTVKLFACSASALQKSWAQVSLSRTIDLWIGSITGIELKENPAFQRVLS